MKKGLKVGFFSFTCCQGCQFTVLFIDELLKLFKDLDIQYFHLLKEKNRDAKFDLAFVEGTITSKREVKKLKKIRNASKFLVAFGACATHGGIPSMRNFIDKKDLTKYVYNQKMLSDSIDASPIDKFIKVDYYMLGCPIIKEEFVNFLNNFKKGIKIKEFEGPVCNECPRRGANCYLKSKIECLGALTRGGCNALCIRENIPCTLCRGPLKKANFAAEVKLFKTWGLSEKDIYDKFRRFAPIKIWEK